MGEIDGQKQLKTKNSQRCSATECLELPLPLSGFAARGSSDPWKGGNGRSPARDRCVVESLNGGCSTSSGSDVSKPSSMGRNSNANGAPSIPYSFDKVFSGDVAT